MPADFKAYEAVFADKDAEIKNLRVHSRIDAPAVRNAFECAAGGVRVVDQALVETLTGKPEKIHFNSYDVPAEKMDFTDFTLPITALYVETFKKKRTPEQEKAFEDAYDALSAKTGYDRELLEKIYRDSRTGSMRHPDAAQTLSDSFNQELISLKTSTGGLVYQRIFLPHYESNESAQRNHPFLADLHDPPPEKFPASKEMLELLAAFHESEHMASKNHGETASGYGKWKENAADEIDADLAFTTFLNKNGFHALTDRMLQERMVSSFKDGLTDYSGHDTATFIRILDETGRQIDLEKFQKDKRGLMEKIAVSIGLHEDINIRKVLAEEKPPDKQYPKTVDIMGAVKDILKEDNEQKELQNSGKVFARDKILSPVQRAEAESFLRDAEALGYVANADYKTKSTPDTEPAAPISQTTPKTFGPGT